MKYFLVLLLSVVCHAQVYMGSINDSYAGTRSVPGSISGLAITPTAVLGTRNVILNQDLYAAFKSKFTLTSGTILVNTTTGNDSTCVVNTRLACKSIRQAVRIKSSSFIYVTCPSSGVYTPQANDSDEYDFRFTDPCYGSGAKTVIFDKPCHVEFAGDNIGTNTWTATAGHSGVYQTTLACYPASCGWVSSVQRTDQNDGSGFVDAWGNAFNDRLYTAFPNACASGTYTTGQYTYVGSYNLYQATGTVSTCPPGASWTLISSGIGAWTDTAGLANLDSLAAAGKTGWWFSPTGSGILYVTFNGLNLTTPANAAKLSARYYPQGNGPGGNNPRSLVLGATLFYQNAFLDGMHFEAQQYNNSGTDVDSGVWCEWCTIFDALGYGAQLDGGAWNNFQNTVSHANSTDGFNADLGNLDLTTPSHMELVYVRSTWAGDPHMYLSGTLPGTQPVNNGESSHSGFSVHIGGFYSQNYGPECADTARSSTTNQSWYVGVFCGNVLPANTSNWGGIVALSQTITSPNNRQVWIDTGTATGETVGGVIQAIYIDSPNSACKIYNTTYTTPVAGGGSCTSYTPNSP